MAFKTSKPTQRTKDEINYEVHEECGDIYTKSNGDVLKLRFMSWNGREPKYDIRYWYEDDTGIERMRKGISLTGEELDSLCQLLKAIENAD